MAPKTFVRGNASMNQRLANVLEKPGSKVGDLLRLLEVDAHLRRTIAHRLGEVVSSKVPPQPAQPIAADPVGEEIARFAGYPDKAAADADVAAHEKQLAAQRRASKAAGSAATQPQPVAGAGAPVQSAVAPKSKPRSKARVRKTTVH